MTETHFVAGNRLRPTNSGGTAIQKPKAEQEFGVNVDKPCHALIINGPTMSIISPNTWVL